MIASLNGKLIFKDSNSAVVECGGVGMRCLIAQTTSVALPAVNENVFLYTYLSVREDALDLYGFAEESELQAFKLITSVNGVGAKIGLAILSQFTADQLYLLIASSDAKALTAASGVGIKLAQRIVLELKDKASKQLPSGVIAAPDDMFTSQSENIISKDSLSQAIAALVSLGYSRSEAVEALSLVDSGLDVDDMIRQALLKLARM